MDDSTKAPALPGEVHAKLACDEQGRCLRHHALGHREGACGWLSEDDLGTLTEVADEASCASDPVNYAQGAFNAVEALAEQLCEVTRERDEARAALARVREACAKKADALAAKVREEEFCGPREAAEALRELASEFRHE